MITGMKKKLTRDTEHKMIAGVMAGLAEYFDVDVALLRLLGAVAFVFTGFAPFGILYLLAWIIIPDKNINDPEYTMVE
jgi:phage shock protein PspC (stress-responsive transcriptional regulator)